MSYGFCMQKNLAQIVELLRLLFEQKAPCQVIYILIFKVIYIFVYEIAKWYLTQLDNS
jgi:hypothetical protein